MAISLDPTAEIVALQQRVRMRDDASLVAEFLKRHPRMVPLLREAAERLGEFFPTDARVALEYFKEPDDPEGPAKLYAIIESDLPPAEAQERLYRFRDAWWRAASGDFIGQLTLVTE